MVTSYELMLITDRGANFSVLTGLPNCLKLALVEGKDSNEDQIRRCSSAYCCVYRPRECAGGLAVVSIPEIGTER